MQIIKSWALSLVLISVLGSIVLILSPSGTVEKQLRTAVSLVMLVCLVNPFLSGFDNEIGFDESILQSVNDNVDFSENPLAEMFSADLENKIVEFLFTEGISVLKVEVEMHQNDNSEMTIEGLDVEVSSDYEDKKDEIYNLIREKYGIIATVEVID